MGEQTSTYSFVVEKMKAQAQKWTIDELILQLRLLLQLEFDSKRGAIDFSSAITLWLFKNVSVAKD
jgi:DNA polymerase III delta subunit